MKENFLRSGWSSLVTASHDFIPVKYGFLMNEGIWIHLIGAGILAKVIRHWLPPLSTVLAVIAIAVAWELVEAYLEVSTAAKIIEVYGSVARYAWDTAGDIVGAAIIALIVAL